MNPNPTIDNDLQKAIDDITNNTNNDPVFGDSIAAPEPIDESAPAPMPMPKPAKAPRPAASFPEVGMPPAPKPMKAPTFRPAPAPRPAAAPMPEPEMIDEEYSEDIAIEDEPSRIPGDLREVRDAALRDITPLVDKLDMSPDRKFDLYRNIREELHDDSVIAPAYESAKDIADDKERADALLYLINSIDNI